MWYAACISPRLCSSSPIGEPMHRLLSAWSCYCSSMLLCTACVYWHERSAVHEDGTAMNTVLWLFRGTVHGLYPTHVPLNPLQKGAVAIFGALGALIRWEAPTCLILLHFTVLYVQRCTHITRTTMQACYTLSNSLVPHATDQLLHPAVVNSSPSTTHSL